MVVGITRYTKDDYNNTLGVLDTKPVNQNMITNITVYMQCPKLTYGKPESFGIPSKQR